MSRDERSIIGALICALVSTLGAAAPASARAAEPGRAPLDVALGGIERGVDGDAVRGLGPTADRILVALADDPAASPLRRSRAIYALRFVPGPYARSYLDSLLARHGGAVQGTELMRLGGAIAALSPYGADALPSVLPFVTHRAASIRSAAVFFLTSSGAPGAEAVLRARAAVEPDRSVRRAIFEGLDRLLRSRSPSRSPSRTSVP